MTTQTRLGSALRRRFPGAGGPRAALLALGLDADLLGPAAGGKDPLMTMRAEVQALIKEFYLDEAKTARLLAVLDKHCPEGRVDAADPNAERARELAGDDRDVVIRDFLEGLGLSAVDIEAALKIARRGEDGEAKDRLPVPATKGGGFGGYHGRDEDRAGRRPAMDSRARAQVEADLDKQFPGFSRVVVGLDYGPALPGPAAVPSEEARRSFAALFPDAARIGS